MSIAAFTNALSRSIAKRLSRAIASNDKAEIRKLSKVLQDKQKLQDDVKKIQEKYQKGSDDFNINVDKDIDKLLPDNNLVSGEELIPALKKMTTHDPEQKDVATGGFHPDTLKDIGNQSFKKEIADVDEIARNSIYVDEYMNTTKELRPGFKQNAPEDVVPPIVGSNGHVMDGYNRIHKAKLEKEQGIGNGKIEIYRGQSILKNNADDVVTTKIGNFVDNLKKKINTDFGMAPGQRGRKGGFFDEEGIITKKGTFHRAEFGTQKHRLTRTSFARAYQKGSNNRDPKIEDDELLVGFAVDVLRAARDNKGGAPGRKLTYMDEAGDVRVVSAKNMNDLSKDIGQAADARMINRGGTPLNDIEQRHLGRMLLEFGRGNFGGKFDDLTEVQPTHLLKETLEHVDAGKGKVRKAEIITTSDYFNYWEKSTGHNGRDWLNLYPNNRSLKAPSIKHHGNWEIDPKTGLISKAPAGVEITGHLGGGKGDTSLTVNNTKVLNILGHQKIGVDRNKYEYWNKLGEKGRLHDTGLNLESLEKVLRDAKLTDEEEVILSHYWVKLKELKDEFMDLEDSFRAKKGEPLLTKIERQNFDYNKILRPELAKQYYHVPRPKKGEPKIPEGRKADLDNTIDGMSPYPSDNNNFLKALQAVNREYYQIKPLNRLERARFKRVQREIEERRKLNPDGNAEVYIPYMGDYRTRKYGIDKSGANHLTGGSSRFIFAFPESQAKPITYNDDAFKVLVDDLLRFENNPITQTRNAKGILTTNSELKKIMKQGLGKNQSDDLQRWKYWQLTKEEYLRRAEDLLRTTEKSIGATAKEADKIWASWNPKWLDGLKDQPPYLANLLEIARIKRAFDKGEPPILNLDPNLKPALDVKPPNAHASTHPVELDASVSGSQHIGAQYKDLPIMWSTNVYSEASGKPRKYLTKAEVQMLEEGVDSSAIARDLYTDVKVEYGKHFNAKLAELQKTDPKRAQIYKELTDNYIQVGRSTTKPIVMKVPYGAGLARLKQSLELLLGSKDRLKIMADYDGAVGDSTVLPQAFMDFHWDSMKGALRTSLDTQYEFKRFNSVIMGVYTDAPSTTLKARKPFLVKSPSGGTTDFTMYAMQNFQTREQIPTDLLPSMKQKTRTIQRESKKKGKFEEEVVGYNPLMITSDVPIAPTDKKALEIVKKTPKKDLEKIGLSGENLELFAVDNKMIQESPFMGRSKTSMATALAPNVTHSLDAAFLDKLVIELSKLNIPVYVVHDAFFVMAPDVRKTKEIAGQIFIKMHNDYNLRNEMIKGLAKATNRSYNETKRLVDDRMRYPSKVEMGQGIKEYPNGALGMKSDAPLGSPESLMSYAPEGVQVASPDDVRFDNVIIGG